MKLLKITLILFNLFALSFHPAMGQIVTVDINPRVAHTLDTVSRFDRQKFVNIHSSLTESDWNGEEDKLEYILRDLDVYMGRDNGGIGWYYNQSEEDPDKPGFVNPNWMFTQGNYVKNTVYGKNRADRHPYEDKSDIVIGAQYYPFWPGSATQPYDGKGSWITTAEGTGDYMGSYLKYFFRDPGQAPTQGAQRPRYIEVMNEPLYEFVTVGSETPFAVFDFHNTVAGKIRTHNTSTLIGGYTTAFPYLDEEKFQRWHDRFKLFMDKTAENMDFLSLHFYDFDQHWKQGGGFEGPYNFKGGRLEATFDMIEQYSMKKFGLVKPMFISEYAGRSHQLESSGIWSSQRDWIQIKSLSPMMLSYMERANVMIKAIPFIMAKAAWSLPDIHGARLMRMNKEKPGETGDHYVYTDKIHYYELWSDVKGQRVDTRSTDLDIMCDAFVNGNKLYLVLCNLEFTDREIELNLTPVPGNPVTGIKSKALFQNEEKGVGYSVENLETTSRSIVLGKEGTTILEYSFSSALDPGNTSREFKYFAESYLQEIPAGKDLFFQIKNINKGPFGEAILRLSFGRDHGLSLQPVVLFNGVELNLPESYRGDDQALRENWYGMLEIDVPYDILKKDNVVAIRFPDQGGFISSVTLQSFLLDLPLQRTGWGGEVSGLNLVQDTIRVQTGQNFQLWQYIQPLFATDKSLSWTSGDESVATVDSTGLLRALSADSTWIFALTTDGGFRDSCLVIATEEAVIVPLESIIVSPAERSLKIEQSFQFSAITEPWNATYPSVNWSSSAPKIVSVDQEGEVKALAYGTAIITAVSIKGSLEGSALMNIKTDLEDGINCSPVASSFPTTIHFPVEIAYTCAEAFDIGVELRSSDDSWIAMGQVSVQPGSDTVNIPLTGVKTSNWTPSKPLPGDDYRIGVWIRDIGGNWTTNREACFKENLSFYDPSSASSLPLYELKIYPNPTSREIRLEGLPEGAARIRIMDLGGKVVLEKHMQNVEVSLDLEAVAQGFYILNVLDKENNLYTEKLIVK